MEFARLLLPILQLVAVVWVLAAVDVVPVAAQSPAGCSRRCGNVDIPYPFGLETRCAIHGGFVLRCNTTAGKLFHGDTVEVTKISVEDNKSRFNTWTSWQCYDRSTGQMKYSDAWLNLTGTVYVLSADDNKIIVLGCNNMGYMIGDTYVVGCLTKCDGTSPMVNGTCSSTSGCCEAEVPRGVRAYNGYFNPSYNTTKIWQTTPCNYVAVVESASFEFSTTYLTSTVFYDTHKLGIPVVMEWGITRSTCEQAQNDETTPYACVSSNSSCATNDAGYVCRCSKGYQGNPYIVDGCTDIDECNNGTSNPCTSGICENTPGGYTCSCPRGQSMSDNGVCKKKQKLTWMALVVGASIGIVVLVVIITCAYLIQERRKLQHIKQMYFRQHGGLLLFQEMRSRQGVSFKIFSEEELQQATNNFAEKEVIGHGGHGKVYKGVLKSTTEVAVKRCMTIDEQQKKEFGKEMLILSQINHKNIVKLLGCCLEVEVPMLVYEFVPNGTLFHLLHVNRTRHISLDTRLRIACESAEALAYLHSCASPPILHGDVKSANILLNGDLLTAKVSDFGASILASSDESQFVTFVQGTRGYLDPEYMQTSQLTDKSDIYSFGVVLLELFTRKMALNLKARENEKSLSMVFLCAMKENKPEDIIDGDIKNDENVELLEEIVELARHCLEMCGANRPSMKEVADRLDRLRKVLQHPWAHKDPEELDSLLFGESSSINSGALVSTGNFSITKKVAMGLEIGR